MTHSTEILNYALVLAMEFGQNWLQPIQQRLGMQFLELSEKELNNINALCQKVNRTAHRYVYEMNPEKPDYSRYEEFQLFICAKYPWITADNVSKLYSQSCYYAYK